jgi:MinD-like ATPase involved in chromosome partitioning or flagellar assembly
MVIYCIIVISLTLLTGDGTMRKLNLIIADTDEEYLKNLAGFLTNKYYGHFQVHLFSRRECLDSFLTEKSCLIDLMLVTQDFFSPENADTAPVIFLSDNYNETVYRQKNTVNKYQSIDSLVGHIFEILSLHGPEYASLLPQRKTTHIVAVYSPAGGVGKTTVAVSLSIYFANTGLTSFYLNFEDIQSTPCFFACDTSRNFSHILYYLKESDKNIPLRISNTSCTDNVHKVRYFAPPDSVLDMDEIMPGELGDFIDQIRSNSMYDVVIIDMSSCFDEKNLMLLSKSDKICLVFSQDEVAAVKMKVFEKELEYIAMKKGIDMSSKVVPVLNRYAGRENNLYDNSGYLYENALTLPYKKQSENSFSQAVEKLAIRLSVCDGAGSDE